MKREIREYAIRKNGYYLQETEFEGMYFKVNDLSKATTFPTIENTVKYVEDDLRLNVKLVTIVEVKTTIEETALVIDNEGNFTSIDNMFNCNVCSKWFPLQERNIYRHDLESAKEELCNECYEELDNKYRNILDDQFDKPLEQLDKVLNIRGGK